MKTFKRLYEKLFLFVVNNSFTFKLIKRHLTPGNLVSLVVSGGDRRELPFYPYRQYAFIDRLVRKYSHNPSRIVEIGPGVNAGVLYCFSADETIQRLAAVDIAPMQNDNIFYERLWRLLGCVGGFKWWRAAMRTDKSAKYPNSWLSTDYEAILSRIEYHAPYPAHQLPFGDGEFDLVYSVTVLEHVDEPKKTLMEFRRILSDDGIMVHFIDMSDHYRGPLEFLKWSQEEYETRVAKYGGECSLDRLLAGTWTKEAYCNRLRLSDWLKLLDEVHFKTIEIIDMMIVDKELVELDRYAKPFKTKSVRDLRVASAVVVCEKENNK